MTSDNLYVQLCAQQCLYMTIPRYGVCTVMSTYSCTYHLHFLAPRQFLSPWNSYFILNFKKIVLIETPSGLPHSVSLFKSLSGLCVQRSVVSSLGRLHVHTPSHPCHCLALGTPSSLLICFVLHFSSQLMLFFPWHCFLCCQELSLKKKKSIWNKWLGVGKERKQDWIEFYAWHEHSLWQHFSLLTSLSANQHKTWIKFTLQKHLCYEGEKKECDRCECYSREMTEELTKGAFVCLCSRRFLMTSWFELNLEHRAVLSCLYKANSCISEEKEGVWVAGTS